MLNKNWLIFLTTNCTLVDPLMEGSENGDKPTPEQRLFDWTELPFPKEIYRERRSKLINAVNEAGGGIFLAPSRHGLSENITFRQLDDFLYFTGLELPDSVLAIDADQNNSILFTQPRDMRFEDVSRKNDFPGRLLGDDPELPRVAGISDIRPFDELTYSMRTWVEEDRRFLLNPGKPSEIPCYRTDYVYQWNAAEALIHHLQQEFKTITIGNAYAKIAKLRMLKSNKEIDVIRKACKVTGEAIIETAGFIREGLDERSLEAELEAGFKRAGGQRVAFSSIIKSGPNSLWPWRILVAHYNRRNRKMNNGELVIFDVGTELDYYVSDVGRTFPVSGKFNAQQMRTLEMSTFVSDAIIDAIKPGIRLKELTEIAQAKIPAGERKYMQTGSYYGHHIGLSTHDPALMDIPLAPGMVFTVEPYYYNHDKGLSVFIEDDVVVTESGVEVLTASLPRSPRALEKLVGRK